LKAVATILLIAVFPTIFCLSWKSEGSPCYQLDVSWSNNSVLNIISPVNDATQCQKLCKDTNDCIAWTWTSQNHLEIQEACLLFASIGDQIPFPDSISGSRPCVCSDEFACKGTPENEISFHENVMLEEICQEFCYNTSSCAFYTWYDSSEVLSNVCVLLKSCDHIYDDCDGCFSGPPQCEAPKPELGIIISGGGPPDGTLEYSVLLLDENGFEVCSLPNLPVERYWHTQDGLIACGGNGGVDARRSCHKFVDGDWVEIPALFFPRSIHSSWLMSNGDLMLIGGGDEESYLTTEIIFEDGMGISPSFNLEYEVSNACTIQLDDKFIITGGWPSLLSSPPSSALVSAYNGDGFMGYLPNLNRGRYAHGCGYFISEEGNQVFLVTGGANPQNLNALESTEIYAVGDETWITLPGSGNLPSPRSGLKGASLNNRIFMTGGVYMGADRDSVLEFNIESKEWEMVSFMKMPRSFHGTSIVPMSKVKDYCL